MGTGHISVNVGTSYNSPTAGAGIDDKTATVVDSNAEVQSTGSNGSGVDLTSADLGYERDEVMDLSADAPADANTEAISAEAQGTGTTGTSGTEAVNGTGATGTDIDTSAQTDSGTQVQTGSTDVQGTEGVKGNGTTGSGTGTAGTNGNGSGTTGTAGASARESDLDVDVSADTGTRDRSTEARQRREDERSQEVMNTDKSDGQGSLASDVGPAYTIEDLKACGFTDEDIQRVLDGKITPEELYVEILYDKDNTRRRKLMETSFLKSLFAPSVVAIEDATSQDSQFNQEQTNYDFLTIDDVVAYESQLKAEYAKVLREKNDAKIAMDIEMHILDRLREGESLEEILEEEIIGTKWIDEYGFSHITFGDDRVDVNGRDLEDIDVRKYIPEDFLLSLRGKLTIVSKGSWLFGNERNEYEVGENNKRFEDFCARVEAQYKEASANDNELSNKLKEIEKEVNRCEAIKQYVETEINNYMDHIDEYASRPDFSEHTEFDHSAYERAKNIEVHDPWFGDEYLEVNDPDQIYDLMCCMVNQRCIAVDDKITLNFHKYDLETDDDLLDHMKNMAKFLNTEEIEVYNYIYNTEGPKAAYEYIKRLEDILDDRYTADKELRDRKLADDDSPYYKLFLTLKAVVGGIGDGANSIGETVNHWITGEKIWRSDVYSSSLTDVAVVQEGILADWRSIDENSRTYKFLGEMFAGGYGIAKSMLDSAVLIGAGKLLQMGLKGVAALRYASTANAVSAGTITGVEAANTAINTFRLCSALGKTGQFILSATLMGSKAYDSALNDALARGMDEDRSVIYAFSMAAVETIMENYSLTHLMNFEGKVAFKINSKLAAKFGSLERALLTPKGKWMYSIGFTLSQAFVEAEEEMATQVLDSIIDLMIANDTFYEGDYSDMSRKVEEYIKEGYSGDIIAAKLMGSQVVDVLEAGIGGFMSGLCFGGIESDIKMRKMINNMSTQIAKVAIETQYGRTLDELIASGVASETIEKMLSQKSKEIQKQMEELQKTAKTQEDINEGARQIAESVVGDVEADIEANMIIGSNMNEGTSIHDDGNGITEAELKDYIYENLEVSKGLKGKYYAMFQKLLADNDIKITDLKCIGKGESGSAFELPDGRILKITSACEYLSELDSDYIIKPDLIAVDNTGIAAMIVEKLDTSNITQDDVEKVFKELLKEGYIWSDLKVDNIGRDANGNLKVLDYGQLRKFDGANDAKGIISSVLGLNPDAVRLAFEAMNSSDYNGPYIILDYLESEYQKNKIGDDGKKITYKKFLKERYGIERVKISSDTIIRYNDSNGQSKSIPFKNICDYLLANVNKDGVGDVSNVYEQLGITKEELIDLSLVIIKNYNIDALQNNHATFDFPKTITNFVASNYDSGEVGQKLNDYVKNDLAKEVLNNLGKYIPGIDDAAKLDFIKSCIDRKKFSFLSEDVYINLFGTGEGGHNDDHYNAIKLVEKSQDYYDKMVRQSKHGLNLDELNMMRYKDIIYHEFLHEMTRYAIENGTLDTGFGNDYRGLTEVVTEYLAIIDRKNSFFYEADLFESGYKDAVDILDLMIRSGVISVEVVKEAYFTNNVNMIIDALKAGSVKFNGMTDEQIAAIFSSMDDVVNKSKKRSGDQAYNDAKAVIVSAKRQDNVASDTVKNNETTQQEVTNDQNQMENTVSEYTQGENTVSEDIQKENTVSEYTQGENTISERTQSGIDVSENTQGNYSDNNDNNNSVSHAKAFQLFGYKPGQIYKLSYQTEGRIEYCCITASENGTIDFGQYAASVGISDFSQVELIGEATKEEMTVSNFRKISDRYFGRYVFPDTHYGGNQENVMKDINSLYRGDNKGNHDRAVVLDNLISKYFPEATPIQRMNLAEHFAKAGCSYIAYANAFLSDFVWKDDEGTIFKEKFGFDMFDSDVIMNSEVLAFDMYLSRFSKEYGNDINKILSSKAGTHVDDVYTLFKSYFAEHGINMNITKTSNIKNNSELTDAILNSNTPFNIIMSDHFDLDFGKIMDFSDYADEALQGQKQDNNRYAEDVGGHAMLVTNINEDGSVEVSTWSQKAKYLFDQISGTGNTYCTLVSVSFDLMNDNVDVNNERTVDYGINDRSDSGIIIESNYSNPAVNDILGPITDFSNQPLTAEQQQIVNYINNQIAQNGGYTLVIKTTSELTTAMLEKVTDLSKLRVQVSGPYVEEAGRLKGKYYSSDYIDRFSYSGYELLDIVSKIEYLYSKVDMSLPTVQRAHQIYEIIASEIPVMRDYEEYEEGHKTAASLRGITDNNAVGKMGLVCAGYAVLFQELCTRAGINCEYIRGRAKVDLITGRLGEKHAWNVITDDNGNIIPVDVCWKASMGEEWFGGSAKFDDYHVADEDEKHRSYKYTNNEEVNKLYFGILDSVVQSIDNETGDGLVRLLDLVLNGDYDSITSVDNCRKKVKKLPMDLINEYLKQRMNPSVIDLINVFNINATEHNIQDTMNGLIQYVNTGNPTGITHINNARQILLTIPKSDIISFLKGIDQLNQIRKTMIAAHPDNGLAGFNEFLETGNINLITSTNNARNIAASINESIRIGYLLLIGGE